MAVEPGPRTTPGVRVNLLPPEIEERRQAQRIQVIAGAIIAAAVVVVVFLYVVVSHSASVAKSDLAKARAQQGELAARKQALQSVDTLHAERDAREQLLTAAMGQEVLFSTYLNTLQRTLPDRVWIVSYTATLNSDPAAAAIGNVIFVGRTISANQDDVAVFLETLSRPKGYTGPYLSSVVEAQTTRESHVPPFFYDFSATVQLTPEARSGRYTDPGGPNR